MFLCVYTLWMYLVASQSEVILWVSGLGTCYFSDPCLTPPLILSVGEETEDGVSPHPHTLHFLLSG